MPHCAAACCRGTPSRTNAIASSRRTWAGSSLAQAAARSCAGVSSRRVTATAAPMLRSPANQHRADRISLPQRWKDTGESFLSRAGISGEVDLIRDGGRGTPVRILAPRLGQVELAVDQGVALAAGLGQEDADLHVLNPTCRAAVLPGHAGGLLALLQEAGFINDEHAIRGAERLDDIVAAQLLGGIGIPQRVAEHALCAPGPCVTDLLGQLPAILAFRRAQQAFEVQARLPPRLGPAEQRAEPLLQRSQLIPPDENACRFYRHIPLRYEVGERDGKRSEELNCSTRACLQT